MPSLLAKSSVVRQTITVSASEKARLSRYLCPLWSLEKVPATIPSEYLLRLRRLNVHAIAQVDALPLHLIGNLVGEDYFS